MHSPKISFIRKETISCWITPCIYTTTHNGDNCVTENLMDVQWLRLRTRVHGKETLKQAA